MPAVLVTGASGFVGRWAAKALTERGFEVHGASRRCAAVLQDVVAHDLDLHDTNAVAALIAGLRPSHLLLSAWATTHGVFWTDPANDDWIASSLALVRCFLDQGGRRIVLAGTCAEYDWSDAALKNGPVAEAAAQGPPQAPYGCAKRKAADAIAGLAKEAGASFATGRIFFPMGWAESPQRFLPTIVNAILDGRPARLGSGEQVRDVMDVRDVGAALAALIACNVEGPVNIGSGVGTALADVARRAGAFGGRPDLLQLGTLPARAGEPERLVADVGRLRDEVGFTPRYKLDETIASSFDYWTRQKSKTAALAINGNS